MFGGSGLRSLETRAEKHVGRVAACSTAYHMKFHEIREVTRDFGIYCSTHTHNYNPCTSRRNLADKAWKDFGRVADCN